MNCLHCKKETNNPKYCSRSCAAKESNKIPKRKLKRKCSKCNSLVKDYRSSLCQYHYELNLLQKKENVMNLTIEHFINKESVKRLHPSSKFVYIRGLGRSWHKDKLKLPCHACGYTKHVELAHIKPLHSFPVSATIGEVNASNNVIQLCPNCHWEFDNNLLKVNLVDGGGLEP